MSTTISHGGTALPELLSLRQLAEYLGVPPSSVYYLRTQGKGPPGFLLGKQLRFRVADVDTWLQEQATRAGDTGRRPSVVSKGRRAKRR